MGKSLEQVFDLIFNSSKQVLGNISSIGIRYGNKKDSPDHMLIVFPHDVYGFESWNSRNKCRWRYHRQSKTILKDDKTISAKESKSFMKFVQASMTAVNNHDVEFSKNIRQSELKGMSQHDR